MSSVVGAALFALEAHRGQRYGDRPYIAHLLQVAQHVEARGGSEDQIVAAVLHDVIEDTGVDGLLLRTAFPAAVCDLVEQVTRRAGESYEDFIGRIEGPAVLVKLCDAISNRSELDRSSSSVKPRRRARLVAQYDHAISVLSARLAEQRPLQVEPHPGRSDQWSCDSLPPAEADRWTTDEGLPYWKAGDGTLVHAASVSGEESPLAWRDLVALIESVPVRPAAVWIDPARMGGTPCLFGTRIPVYHAVNHLVYGWSLDEYARDYGHGLSERDILVAVAWWVIFDHHHGLDRRHEAARAAWAAWAEHTWAQAWDRDEQPSGPPCGALVEYRLSRPVPEASVDVGSAS